MVIIIVSIVLKSKLKSHMKVCGNKKFCNVLMSPEDTKILELNQYGKSDKAPFIIDAYPESLIVKIDGRKNNPTKISKHIPSGFSMSTISPFKGIEVKHDDVYRGKDCMKNFVNI